MTVRSRIAIVEDHKLLAETAGIALSAAGFDVVVADLTDRDTVLATVIPDESVLVLLDLDLGGSVLDGTTLIPVLTQRGAGVLVVTGVHDRLRLAAALEAGALGYVVKDSPFDVLLGIVVRAADGAPVIDAGHRHQMLTELRQHRALLRAQHEPFDALTPKERDVLERLMAGKSVESIAREYVVSTATVRTQVRAILTKLEVNSQLAAVAKARAVGWGP